MTPQLIGALSRSSMQDRNRLVMALMSKTGPDANYPEFWRGCADLISQYEPDMTATNVSDAFVAACASLHERTLYRMVRRLVAFDDDPLMVALGLEAEAARMVLLQIDHAVNEAMRPRWPVDDSGMSAS